MPQKNIADELRNLHALKEQGALTSQEYAELKAKLLASLTTPPGDKTAKTAKTSDRTLADAGEQAMLPREPMPKTYLASAILGTLFCCLPLGIVAIVKASGVQSAYLAGDIERARKLSSEALLWCNVTAVSGVIYILFLIFVMHVKF